MSASQASSELSELKEWLTNEVKLERYFEKLINYGFSSLSLIQNLEESDLDSIGITPPYHRKRMLKFCKDLQMKLSPHVNKECAQTGNDPNESSCSSSTQLPRPEQNESTEHDFGYWNGEEDENEPPPPPLPPKAGSGGDVSKPAVPDRDSSLPRHPTDYNTESNTSATADLSKTKPIEEKQPDLPPSTTTSLETNNTSSFSEGNKDVKKAKKPPPIPPRSDLPEETTSCEEQGGETHETNEQNEQNVLTQDTGTSEDTNSQMPYVPARVNAPKPVPRPRIGIKEKPLNTPSNQLLNSTDETDGKDALVKDTALHHLEEIAQSKEIKAQSDEDDEPIYGNKDECLQAVAAPVVQLPVTNKKPLPLPRVKPRPKQTPTAASGKQSSPLLPDGTKQDYRHSIAVAKKTDEEEKAPLFKNGKKHSRSLNRLDRFAHVISDLENFKSPGLTTGDNTTSPSSQPNQCRAVSPPSDDEQDNYEVMGSDPKDDKGSLGTYEDVQMPTRPENPPITQEDIYECIDNQFLPAGDTKPSGGDNSLVAGKEPSKEKQSPAADHEDVIYDYESDESTEGVLLVQPPELPEERKPRGESTDSFDGKAPKSATPKSRKTCGYLFKQGGQQNNRGWKKRWFVFDGRELRYYRSEENTQESLHVIPVSQMKNVEFGKESKKGRFNLITPNRVFMLSSDSMADTNLWAQTLMEAILQYKEDDSAKKIGGVMSDPDKEGWLKKQGHNVMGDWKRRYVAIKEDKICYYDTYEDFMYATPINCIEAKLATVKQDSHRNRFLIVTFNKEFSFQAENEFEAASWISAIQTAIQMGLSDHLVINQVWSNPANKKCADCGKKDPVWSSVNYCICVCARCIGIHRSLGVKYSKPRSLLMDERIWNKQLLELMLKIGNDNANKLLEFRIPDDDRINPNSDNEKRIEFIFSKYKDMKYMKISEDYGKREALGQSLQKAVVKDDVLKTMELLINRAEVKYVNPESEDQRPPLELAKDAGQELQAELLRQNGADAIEEPVPVAVPDEADMGFEKDNAAELSSHPVVEVPDKAGFLLVWKKKYWFTLKDRQLKYFRYQGDKDPSGVIDLATVTSLELHANEDTRTLDCVTTEKTYSIKAESDDELDSWYTAIKNKQVFNVHLRFQELGSDGIPHLVAHCLQFVETYGLQAEGIYRVSGNQAKMRALMQSFNQDASRVMLTLDDYSVHDVTGTLKKYLRGLPEPVVPDNMYKTFIMASCLPDHDSKLYAIKDALVKLPKVNYDTLKRIISHLKKVIADQAINRMGIENISMIFAPTVMSNDNTGKMDNSSINQEFKIIGDLIQYYDWFFDVDDKEKEKDKLMEEARKKIILIQEPGKSGMNQEFNLDIYVQQKNDHPCLIKVAAGMTAGELCMTIMQKKELPPETNWALFEVIGKLNLERAMQFREKVLPVVMSWEAFGEISKDNYLIIKENHIAESIQPFVGTSLNMEGQLHVREPKRRDWKLSTVVLKNGYMVVDKSKSFFKTIKSDKSDNDQWSLHNLVVFLGVPSEKSTKNVDTSAGFTVVVKTDLHGNLMRYLCAKDKTEMYRWVAAILNMKHPEGIWTDPTAAAELTSRRVKDKQIYLGRQSRYLRKEGSSNQIAEEIRTRQKSLRRSVHVPRS